MKFDDQFVANVVASTDNNFEFSFGTVAPPTSTSYVSVFFTINDFRTEFTNTSFVNPFQQNLMEILPPGETNLSRSVLVMPTSFENGASCSDDYKGLTAIDHSRRRIKNRTMSGFAMLMGVDGDARYPNFSSGLLTFNYLAEGDAMLPASVVYASCISGQYPGLNGQRSPGDTGGNSAPIVQFFKPNGDAIDAAPANYPCTTRADCAPSASVECNAGICG